ncbi:MAG: hypothetical protein RL094_630 [Candidatus Parcubacteria bacterium]|jgi:FKBP-type peptidyl-prolyl cis-trans isomerase
MNKNILLSVLVIIVLIVLGVAIYKSSSDMSQIAQNGDTVYVHYTGTLENGTKFDSSYDRGQPLPFVLGAGMVIRGWDQGILGMSVGEKKHLIIPPELGYGAQSITDNTGNIIIPRNATLVFDVELTKIEKGQGTVQQ